MVVVAVVIVAVEKAKFTPSVRSAERSPPPKRPAPAVIVRVEYTAVMPKEKAAVLGL